VKSCVLPKSDVAGPWLVGLVGRFSPIARQIVTANQDGKAIVWQRLPGTHRYELKTSSHSIGDRFTSPAS